MYYTVYHPYGVSIYSLTPSPPTSKFISLNPSGVDPLFHYYLGLDFLPVLPPQ